MAAMVLIDSGPLVAALRRRDQHHAWARARFEASTEPFVTCEAVISESFFLLEGSGMAKAALWDLLERGVVQVQFQFAEVVQETVRLMRRYRDLPMSFADACLVRMAEQTRIVTVLTTDSHFRVYRRNGREPISLIMPE